MSTIKIISLTAGLMAPILMVGVWLTLLLNV